MPPMGRVLLSWGSFSEDNNHGRKGSGVFTASKLEPAFDEPHLRLPVNIIVKAFCVGSGRYQHDCYPPPKAMLIAFSDPLGLLLIRIRRVAEHRFSSPVLDKPVILFGVKFGAFCRFWSCAGIERKMKLRLPVLSSVWPLRLCRRSGSRWSTPRC